MGRYIFSKRDLEPLRGLIDSPLGQAVLGSTVPIKQTSAAPPHPEITDVALPVPVQSREQPEGLPLHEILSAVQTESPEIKALAVREGSLVVSYAKPPTDAERARVERALANPQTFARLRTIRPSALAGPAPADLESTLTNPATPDGDWLKAFRQYAVAKLLPARREPVAEPSPPNSEAATKPKSPRRGNS
jgi:hypothetical protein